jgi:hypothetical protein
LKNAKDEKSNMLWKRMKIKWHIFGEGGNRKQCKWWNKGGKIKYEITTSLISR